MSASSESQDREHHQRVAALILEGVDLEQSVLGAISRWTEPYGAPSSRPSASAITSWPLALGCSGAGSADPCT
jgi:hypothetical protein